MIKRKIAISAGHYPESPGAKYNGFIEHEEAVKVVNFLRVMFDKNYEILLTGGKLTKKVREINEFKPELAVEVHFNGHVDNSACGIETLHANSENGIRLANCVQRRMVERLKRPDRGIKIGYYQADESKGLIYFIKETHCPAIITEGLFLSNMEESLMLKTERTHGLYASAIYEGINDYLIDKLRREG